MTSTTLVLQLKTGVESALQRLQDVRKRRKIGTVILKNDADENDSGWSEEEWDTKITNDHIPMSTDDFHKLFTALGTVTSITNLVVDYYLHPIPIRALALMFETKDPIHLESLKLRHAMMAGTERDFQEFSDSMGKTTKLSTAAISSCNTSWHTLSPLVDGFSCLPTLKELNLEEMDISGETLEGVCRSKSIIKLKLRHIPACNQHMAAISRTLRTNQVLQDLQVRYCLDQEAVESFMEMLEGNDSLERVDIDVAYSERYSLFLSKTFRHNNSLQSLELNIFGEDRQVESNAVVIADSLEHNSTLKRLCLTFQNRLHQNDNNNNNEGQGSSWDQLNKAFVTSFSKIMPYNCALEDLSIGSIHQKVEFDDKVKFYLRLNQAGRKELMEAQCSRRNWIETLIRYRDDLDVLFYLLTLNPSVAGSSQENNDTIIDQSPYKRPRLATLPKQTMG